MAYKSFIPEVWHDEVMLAREEYNVFAKTCTRKYEGEIKEKGDRVKILVLGEATVNTYDDTEGVGVGAPETLQDSSMFIDLDYRDAVNLKIGDIDKVQTKPDVRSEFQRSIARGFSNTQDKRLAALYAQGTAGIVTAASVTDATALDFLDEAAEKLYTNSVPKNSKIWAVVPPKYFTRLRRMLQIRDTDNSQMLKHGKILMYNDINILMSNNVAKKSNKDQIMVYSEDALALVEQLTEIKAYEPDRMMGDYVKAINVYGMKVVRPKELAVIDVAAYA